MQRFTAERAKPGNGVLYPDGDGLLATRLSAHDIQKGETAMGQVHGQRQLCDRLSLRPREILITTNNSGFNRFEERPDFNIIAEEIKAGRIRWVAWRAPERIGREMFPTLAFYDLLKKTGVDLYLTNLGRKVDWKGDALALQALGMVAEREGIEIKERTHGAIKRRWLEEGKGWPNSQPLGFMRNPHTKHLEVDPEQWPFIKRIHYGYAAMAARENGGLRGHAAQLCAEGFPISVEHLSTVLKNPMYVTGEWTTTHNGVEIANTPVYLPDPIPVGVFETNQRLLQVRKNRYAINPLGTYVLNRITILHSRCCDHTSMSHGRAQRTMLRRRQWSDGRKANVQPVYTHSPSVPDCCRGFSLPAHILETKVMSALRGLADNEQLQEAWTRAAFPEVVPRTEVVDGTAATDLRARIGTGERQLQRLHRDWTDRLLAGEDLDQTNYDRMCAPLHAELDALAHQLQSLEVVTEAQAAHTQRIDERTRQDLAGRLREILTDECPEDPDLRLRRMAFVEAALSEIIVHDVVDERPESWAKATGHAGQPASRRPLIEARAEAGVAIELVGPLVSPTVALVDSFDPMAHFEQGSALAAT